MALPVLVVAICCEHEPSSAPAASSTNPFAGEKLWVDPNHEATVTANQWRSLRPGDAALLDKIGKAPASPRYFAEWTEQHGGAAFQVDAHVDKVVAAGALPVLGAYAIPNRDCGSYSAGGFTTDEQYKAWVDGFARGIGDRKAVVILEPDALSSVSCLDEAAKQRRYALLKYAVYSLSANPKHHVYIDVGHHPNYSAGTMVDRLKQSGVERATGFATNISGWRTTEEETAWIEAISPGVGGKHGIIDTSRNGLGPWVGSYHTGGACPNWANAPGRALGERPTADTGHPLVDAYFWLKQPGDSDAACGPFPRAGAWLPDMPDAIYGADAYDALGLARRAAW